MTCKVCRTSMKRTRGDIELWHDDKLIIVQGIQHFLCNNCSERIYPPESAKKIILKIKKNNIKKYIRVPIYS